MVFLAQNPVQSSKSINVKNDSCKLILDPIFTVQTCILRLFFQNIVSISRKNYLDE